MRQIILIGMNYFHTTNELNDKQLTLIIWAIKFYCAVYFTHNYQSFLVVNHLLVSKSEFESLNN